MPHFPRIECGNLTNLTTVRTGQCRIWFRQQNKLEEEILGNLAKCQERYGVQLYAFAIEGTHKHELAIYPECNRSAFQRDLNSSVARSVKRHCCEFEGGALWGRRYSNEFLGTESDVEREFFYTVLQPVQDGLFPDIKLYPGYNCFEDAINERERKFPVVDWARYNSDKRWKKNIRIEEYTTLYTLKYTRLPGYENLSPKEYRTLMRKKLRERTKRLVEERTKKGKGFLGIKKFLQIRTGQRAMNPKLSSRWNFRPRIICNCPKKAAVMLQWLFDHYYHFHEASYRYRKEGEQSVTFPPGMYRPPSFTVQYNIDHADLLASEGKIGRR